ncbi:unnamed protein product [Phaedon cochleariae]|uniref:Nuclear condensin complex subunit 3 C-terminal domain-containing protein n=1 Tax=Phaedon cochleariae TaxID=80249 RepID=A0A9N9SB96_PHACE|nr:unnamed protein product [Phaedon cochleariae]
MPDNPEDPIMSGLIHLMNSDCFAKVRQLCIEKIAASKEVIGHIINRTRDTDPNVRLAAFKRLSAFAGSLKISEKRQILHCGFFDESDKVKEFMNTVLIKSWLEHYNNNILAFMKSLRLDADEKDIENTVSLFESILAVIFKDKILTELTKVLPLNEKRLISVENLNWEVVSYWRIYVQFLNQNEEFDAELEKVVPEMIYFCKYIKEYYVNAPNEITAIEFMEHQFILKQLFLMTSTYDFSDPTNRKCLNSLVTNILENVVLTSDVINVIIGNLEHSIPKSDQRTQFVSEMISDILYPISSEESREKIRENEFQISQLTVKLNQLRVSLEEAVQREDYMEAEQIKNMIGDANASLANLKQEEPAQLRQEKKTDLVTTIKCLDITAAILLSPKINRLTASMRALKEDLIQELLIHDNDTVRVKAMKCYGLCCIADKETASTGIHIFSTPIFAYQNGEECDTQTLLVCISTVVDLLRIYGSQLMAVPEREELSESMQEKQQAVFMGGTSLTGILQGLVDLMDDEQYEIQEKAGLGLCQLILSDRIISPSLICRLVLKWCNPATDDETDRLRQIIGYTLQKMPSMTQCTEQLMDAVLMTIRTLFSAPRTSPLADVNIENIAKFMLALCKTSPDASYIHSSLATTLCGEMLKKPKSKLNLVFAKMLLMLDISDNKMKVDELLDLCDQIRDVSL